MKVDKRNPAHWAYLALFLLNVTLAIVARIFCRRRRARRVILYGHRLSGNLLALYRHLRETSSHDIDVTFLTMDPAYHRELSAHGESNLLATSPRCIAWLATADAVISDHGLHAMLPMLYLSDIKFFDVWHGIPFKGFDASDFRVQHRYDEIWVASPLLETLYVGKFGFAPERVQATGYARTDRLLRGRDFNRSAIARRLKLADNAGKVVLFAPTWQQDAPSRSVFPFGTDADTFCAALSQLAERTAATVVLRTHLNSGAVTAIADRYQRLVSLPYATYPDTEEILLASDVLVCDWSSIAFDFLLLDRPTIFLDVAPPFAKGLSFDASYRYGAIAGDMDELIRLLERYLAEPAAYAEAFSARQSRIQTRVYGDCADGNATARCVQRLGQGLVRDEFSR